MNHLVDTLKNLIMEKNFKKASQLIDEVFLNKTLCGNGDPAISLIYCSLDDNPGVLPYLNEWCDKNGNYQVPYILRGLVYIKEAYCLGCSTFKIFIWSARTHFPPWFGGLSNIS